MDKQESDELLIRIDERVNKILVCLEKQNNRIDVLENVRVRSLEKWKWMQVGVFILIAVVAGLIKYL